MTKTVHREISLIQKNWLKQDEKGLGGQIKNAAYFGTNKLGCLDSSKTMSYDSGNVSHFALSEYN